MLDLIERVTGARPPTCPWQAFDDGLVEDIKNAYQWDESGQLKEYWGDDPPHVLVEGLAHYRRVIRRVLDHDREVFRNRDNEE